jgi:hypothetical protein
VGPFLIDLDFLEVTFQVGASFVELEQRATAAH